MIVNASAAIQLTFDNNTQKIWTRCSNYKNSYKVINESRKGEREKEIISKQMISSRIISVYGERLEFMDEGLNDTFIMVGPNAFQQVHWSDISQ